MGADTLSKLDVITTEKLVELARSQDVKDSLAFVDEMLYHAQAVEAQSLPLQKQPAYKKNLSMVVLLLDDLDKTMTAAFGSSIKRHWTNLREPIDSEFQEAGQHTFLAAVTQANLRNYLSMKLDKKTMAAKKGRLLLDYALRRSIVTTVAVDPQDVKPDFAMVELLLRNGANPNQTIFTYGNDTVWGTFLRQCYRDARNPGITPRLSESASQDLYIVIQLLLRNGADPNYEMSLSSSVPDILDRCLLANEKERLNELLEERRQARLYLGGFRKAIGGSLTWFLRDGDGS